MVSQQNGNNGSSAKLEKSSLLVRISGAKLRTLIIIGCLLSCAGFLGVRNGADNQIRTDFELSAVSRIQVVQREIEDNFGALRVFRAWFESAREDSADAFTRFATQTIASYRTVRAVQWAPRVRDPDRADFEARLREKYPRTTGILAASPGAKPAREAAKGEYYPIEYITWERASPMVGIDVSSLPGAVNAVKRAIITGEPSSTGKLKLWEHTGDATGVLTFLAIYDGPEKTHTAEWRSQHCRGLVISIETPDLLASGLQTFAEQGIHTYVFDLTVSGTRELLYMHPPSRELIGSADISSPEYLLQEKLVYAQKLPAGGRDWQIICVGTDFMPSGAGNFRPMAFLMCGLAVTAALALYLRMVSREASKLASANRHLQSQVLDRQKAHDELHYQAFHDPLTGLPNRRQFGQRFDEAIDQARTAGESLALFYVDLDGFKMINDTLGHAVGDGVLKAVAERFRKNVGRRDVVARTGGDEFNILLVEVGNGELADRVAQALLASLSKPIEVDGRILTLSASIGISLFPDNGQDFQELAHCSDAAMYVAKKRGKNCYERYTSELASSTRRGMELALSLRGAIERKELCLFFQPILGLGIEATLRFEALLRWRHPQIGLLGPAHFLSIAEDAGLTATIGRWVLHEACRMSQSWQSQGHRPIGVSVNVSGLQFSRPEFTESLDSALAASGLSPSLMELELSESSVVAEIEASMERLGAIRRKGVSVAIDDFGTGFSSLTYLETLPIDALKIDRSFLPRSESNFRRSSLLRSLIALGRSLNLRVIVGGIEVSRQFELVRGMGPNEVQGFLFSRPLSSAAVPEFIETWNQRQGSADIDRILEITRTPADLVLVSSRPQAM